MKKTVIVLFGILIFSNSFSQSEIDMMKSKNFFVQASTFIGLNLKESYSSLGEKQNFTQGIYGVGAALGNVWYLNDNDHYRTGIQITWLRTEFGFPDGSANSAFFSIQPLQVGYANLWKRSETKAFGFDINIGYVLQIARNGSSGIRIHPEVKFRVGKLQIGLGYVFTYAPPIKGETTSFWNYATNQFEHKNDMTAYNRHQGKITIGMWN